MAKIGIGLFLVILLEIGIEQIYMHTERYKGSLGGAWNFRKNVQKQLEIVNIGSGPGLYGITYESCRKRGFNFSTAPQNYNYGFRLLKMFSDNLCANCIIIIIIMCPLSFGDNAEYSKPGYADRFYGILPPEEIDGYSVWRAWLLRHPLLKKTLEKWKTGISFVASRCRKSGEKAGGPAAEPGVVGIWKQEFQLKDLTDASQAEKHRTAFAKKRRILQEGIAYCHVKGWRPVFVTPPVPPETRACIGEEFLQAFVYDNLKELQNQYPWIPLLDYYGDSRFEASMFQNDIFVNQVGRQRFSEILFHDIAEHFSED